MSLRSPLPGRPRARPEHHGRPLSPVKSQRGQRSTHRPPTRAAGSPFRGRQPRQHQPPLRGRSLTHRWAPGGGPAAGGEPGETRLLRPLPQRRPRPAGLAGAHSRCRGAHAGPRSSPGPATLEPRRSPPLPRASVLPEGTPAGAQGAAAEPRLPASSQRLGPGPAAAVPAPPLAGRRRSRLSPGPAPSAGAPREEQPAPRRRPLLLLRPHSCRSAAPPRLVRAASRYTAPHRCFGFAFFLFFSVCAFSLYAGWGSGG